MNSLYNTPDTLSPKKKRLPLSGSRTSLVIAVIISAIIPLWRCVFFLPQPPVMFYYGALGILAIMALLSARSKLVGNLVPVLVGRFHYAQHLLRLLLALVATVWPYYAADSCGTDACQPSTA